MTEGRTIEQSIRLSWPDSGFAPEKMEDQVVSAMGKAIATGMDIDYTATVKFKNWALDKYVTADNISLSEKVYTNAQMSQTDIIDTVSAQLRQNSGLNSMARAIDPYTLHDRTILADKIESLSDYSRTALAGDPDAVKAYREAIKDAQKYVEGLSDQNASQGKLKAAYQRVIDATEKGTQEAVDKALDKAINVKARYNAERIARTETARAYGQAVEQRILKDPDAIGLRWELSSVHDEDGVDECEFYATADLYGLGEGCYPTEAVPDYPAHPNCMCILSPIYQGEVPDDNDPDENAQDYLDDLNQDERESLMGVQGAADYEENPDSWREQIGIDDEHEIKDLQIPVED